MRSLPRATLRHYPTKPCTPPLPASYYPQTHTHTLLHTHLTVLFIDDSSLPFLSGYTVNTGAPAPQGLMDWSRLFTAVPFLEWLTKEQRGLCVSGEIFLFSSTGPTDASCTFLRTLSHLSPPFDKLVVFSLGSFSLRPKNLLFHHFICRSLLSDVPYFDSPLSHPLLFRLLIW